MNRYMPLTGHDCTIPALLIDTQSPLDVLHAAAAHRIRAVTQLLEQFTDGMMTREVGQRMSRCGALVINGSNQAIGIAQSAAKQVCERC
ncbi:hypothetical protein [Pseudomonas mucidolens]|uniref:Uncharacterized protein n=1 Tax=Pseudomonas mucidolens TaxID=46679 RepID=A0A1H2NRA7_9PSED|nr:hypothetical protein SAMN05216202_4447 [Pseudomonas mucidolens]SQH31255.1 Uncharacterised protein [Pseudomonas mucidolens]